jgi:hypothetical protein
MGRGERVRPAQRLDRSGDQPGTEQPRLPPGGRADRDRVARAELGQVEHEYRHAQLAERGRGEGYGAAAPPLVQVGQQRAAPDRGGQRLGLTGRARYRRREESGERRVGRTVAEQVRADPVRYA